MMLEAEYRAADGISSHMLADYKKSRRYYYRKHVMRVIRESDKSWQTFGRAYHALTLEGATGFDRDFIVAPDEFVTESGALSVSKAAKAWASEQAATPISPRDYETCAVIAGRVKAHKHMALLMSSGQVEVCKFATHADTGLTIKGRADLVDDQSVTDLKGCQDLDMFIEDAKRYGYVDQIAHYCTLFNVNIAYLCAVEKSEPHRVGMYRIDGRSLDLARERNARALGDLAQSIARDEWADDDEIKTLSL